MKLQSQSREATTIFIVPKLALCAVLFLLLLSGESLKWAKLSVAQQHYVATAQILLTTGVAVAVIIYAICSLGFVKRGVLVRPYDRLILIKADIIHIDCTLPRIIVYPEFKCLN